MKALLLIALALVGCSVYTVPTSEACPAHVECPWDGLTCPDDASFSEETRLESWDSSASCTVHDARCAPAWLPDHCNACRKEFVTCTPVGVTP